MRNTQINFLLLILLVLACCAAACRTVDTTSMTNGKNERPDEKIEKRETAPAAIEINAEALAREWIVNSTVADEKYAGKTLSLTGEVDWVDVFGEQSYINLVGVSPTKTEKGARFSCSAATTDEIKKLQKIIRDAPEIVQRETNRKDVKIPNPKVTVKGVYLKSNPLQGNATIIEIKPCELMPLF